MAATERIRKNLSDQRLLLYLRWIELSITLMGPLVLDRPEVLIGP
jgi:hypothetical protein